MKRSKPTQKALLMQVIREQDGMFKCIAESKCSYGQSIMNPGNFKRHVEALHPIVFDRLGLSSRRVDGTDSAQVKKKYKKLIVDSNKKNLVCGTLLLLTESNLPYSFFESSACKILLGPLYEAASMTLNRKAISDLIDKSSILARNFIKNEMSQKLISLKIDSATRGNRQVLGINAQYYHNNKVVVRNLAIQEMHSRQTKENLKDVIMNTLAEYSVDMKQVYSIAHDNGSNMVATVKVLKEMLEKSSLENPSINLLVANEEVRYIFELPDEMQNAESFESIEIDNCSTTSDDTVQCDDFSEDKQEETKFILSNIDDGECWRMEEILDSTRCAAHTAQLAVWDVVKPYQERITKIQKIVVKLRHREYQKIFKIHNAHLPPIANDTRWNSKYLMLSSLLNQRQFFNLLKTVFPEPDLTSHWPFIEKFRDAFEPAFVLTLKLQKIHCPLSDFYIYWLQCQAQLDKMKSNLHHRLNEIEGVDVQVNQSTSTSEPQDELDKYLSSYFEEEDIPTGISHSINESVVSQIKDLEIREKVPITIQHSDNTCSDVRFDILKYWESHKIISPILHRLAMVVLVAPSTQVSVERAFSGLKLILTDHRMRLCEKSVENLLVLKLNSDLLEQISEILSDEEANYVTELLKCQSV
ncbi:uncharacterized protein LOC131434241 [Malaya genurostris]|uniref:uncharacterized protein LOC131434241 n=1 Tax=Malaya genurostris TaxID=325434 RepID=UPI0026F37E79|nr:uncharacterized protein LOC131434241 [Malaya genurostris]